MSEERRAVPDQTIRPESREHEELKAWTDAGDPGRSQEFADEWATVGTGLTEAAEEVKVALTALNNGWSGDASEAARVRLLGVVMYSATTGMEFTVASEQLVAQGEAAESARRAMPEPVSYDPGQMIKDAQRGGFLDMAMLPYTMPAQKEQHDAAHEEAVRVVSDRDTGLNGTAGTVPTFRVPQPMIADTAGDPGSSDRISTDGSLDERGAESGGSDSGGRGPAQGGPGGPSSSGGQGTQPGTGPSAGQSAPGATTPGGYTPREPNGVPVAATPGFGPVGAGPGGAGYVAGGGFGPVGGGGSGGGSGGGRGGAPGAGGSMAGPGSGRGAGPVVAPGAAGAADAAARGGAGARGAAGMGGMPMGGRGKGDEDDERQRPSYLLEPDPEGAFGDDVLVAPPVIGGPDDE